MIRRRTRHVAIALFAVLAGLWVAADGRHHWDEPTYLYAGAYVDAADILAGHVQPSGIAHFTQGRILHALVVKAVMQVAGSPPAGFALMLAINLLLLAGSMYLLHRILRGLLPEVSRIGEATALVAMSPVILYLAFRVLADAEALFTALLATYALLRLATGGGLGYAALAATSIVVCTLSKNQMSWMPATFWATFCLVPLAAMNRRRLFALGAASGAAAIIATLAILEWIGVGLEAYWASYRGLARTGMPIVAKVLNIATELGVLWVLLPFALLTTRRRELLASALWFVLAMAPFVFVINSIEARHVAANLVAVGMMFALALEAIASRWPAVRLPDGGFAGGIAVAAIVAIMAANAAMLAIMPHRIHTGQMRQVLDTLDARYGAGDYVLLTATGYTDFMLIRVLWPEVDVRDPGTAETAVHDGAHGRQQALDMWYGGRQVDSLDALRAIGKPLAYFGYRHTFAAENMHDALVKVSPALARRALGGVDLPDRLFSPWTEWLWGSADVTLEPIARVGHYHAYEVRIDPP